MKKIAIFCTIIILIVAWIAYMYINYKMNIAKIEQENSGYENYYNKRISGSEVATLINKAVDSNRKNNVEQDEKGMFIDNGENSVIIEFKMLDDEKTYSMEKFYKNDIMQFVEYYRNIEFKCTKIEYHENKRVKYMLIEQMTK